MQVGREGLPLVNAGLIGVIDQSKYLRARAPTSRTSPPISSSGARWLRAAEALRRVGHARGAGNGAAQELKRDVYQRRLAEESPLMAQGIYRAAINDAREALREEPERVRRLVMGWKE